MEQLEELFKGLLGMKGFYRQEGGAWELLTKTKKRILFRPGHLLLGGRQGFYPICYLTSINQKIPD